jgi:hypothetical protein
MKRRDLISAAAGALAASTLAGGVAWAAIPDGGGVISGCRLKVGGILRVIDTSKNEKCLTNFEVPISWNQRGLKGDPGANGVSPTVAQLAVDDSNCPAGGAAITDSAGSTAYVCNGASGQDGTDGQSFAGTFTSPNGQFSISVSDSGITLARGGGPSIQLSANDITARSTGTATIESSGTMTIKGAPVNIN